MYNAHVPNNLKINIEPNHTKDIKKQFEPNKAFNISHKSLKFVPFLNLSHSLFYGIFEKNPFNGS